MRHVNRSLHMLRGKNLVEWKDGVLTALDWEGLKQVGEFHASYLHQEHEHVA
jgi:hypothetical protein